MKFYDCLTEFIFVEHEPQPSDIIFVPGGPYPEAARRAAWLYQKGYAPYILPSGRYSILKEKLELPESLWKELETAGGQSRAAENAGAREESAGCRAADRGTDLRKTIKTESDYLCEVMQQSGVPLHALIPEKEASYTYENAICSRKKLESLGLPIKKAIICCQAFHARRSLMYYQEQFPEVDFLVCPAVTRGISRDTWYTTEEGIDTVLGEVERCGGQFHEIMRADLERRTGNLRYCTDSTCALGCTGA